MITVDADAICAELRLRTQSDLTGKEPPPWGSRAPRPLEFHAELDTPDGRRAPPRTDTEAVVLDLVPVAAVGDVNAVHGNIVVFVGIPLTAHIQRGKGGLLELGARRAEVDPRRVVQVTRERKLAEGCLAGRESRPDGGGVVGRVLHVYVVKNGAGIHVSIGSRCARGLKLWGHRPPCAGRVDRGPDYLPTGVEGTAELQVARMGPGKTRIHLEMLVQVKVKIVFET